MARDLNVVSLTPAGTAQSDATQIQAVFSPAMIVAAGDGTAGLVLPPASKGRAFVIKNTGGTGLKVYPYGVDVINALSPSAAITMATVTSAWFVAKDSLTWYTTPTVPS